MKYVSIDLETCGTDPDKHDVLEIGAVIEDTRDPKPLNMLPRFQCYFVQDVYRGDPFALAMNADILKKIAEHRAGRYPGEPGEQFQSPENVGAFFSRWLSEHGITCDPVNVAGKNFATFDLRFLRRVPGFLARVQFHRRVIDPAGLYWEPDRDEVLPDSKECMRRAGIVGEVRHRAVDDAIDVVRMVRYYFTRKHQAT